MTNSLTKVIMFFFIEGCITAILFLFMSLISKINTKAFSGEMHYREGCILHLYTNTFGILSSDG